MTDAGTPTSDERLGRLLRGALASWLLFVAVDLRLADQLADGPLSVEELGERTGADTATIYRLLRALATEGVFTEPAPGTFANTETSSELRRGKSPWAEASIVYEHVYRSFAEIPHAVRTGEPLFEKTYGTDWWTWLEQNPALGTSFNALMQAGAEARVEVLADLAWKDGETVVDVGGGNGALLIELLRRQPGLRGVVVDLPNVAEEAERRVTDAGLGERCRVVPASFFEHVPEGGDAYVLAKILHDWDDDNARRILERVRAAAPPHSRILIVDAVVTAGDEPDDSKWTDLVMLALVGGRERTEPEWRMLLASAGFAATRVEDDLVQAVPA